jgi:hypothetical protein
MLSSVMTILITSATNGSYSITGKACNLILLLSLSSTKVQLYFSIDGHDLPLLDEKSS